MCAQIGGIPLKENRSLNVLLIKKKINANYMVYYLKFNFLNDWVFRVINNLDYVLEVFFSFVALGLLNAPCMPYKAEQFTYKIFVSGKSFVGKTSSVAHLTANPISSSHSETPGQKYLYECVI